MFFIKQKPIVLECFTPKKHIFDLAKPLLAKDFIPDWWKQIPSSISFPDSFFKHKTLKKCAGVIDYYRSGFMLPLWSDLNIEVGARGTDEHRWQYSDNQSSLETHSFSQLNNYISNKDILHLKLISPWGFRCKENISWRFSEPTWNLLKYTNVRILPGNLDFSISPSSNINIFIERKDIKSIVEFSFGTPLAHITPLSERPLKLVYKHVSAEEFDNLFANTKPITFIGKHFVIKKILKDAK